MYWNRDPRYRAGGYHTCSVKVRERMQRTYHENLVHRTNKQLKHRRREALKARAKRSAVTPGIANYLRRARRGEVPDQGRA